MKFFILALYASLASVSAAHKPAHKGIKTFTTLVTFGDSYTDENRLSYLASHNNTGPPPGTLLPISYATAGGGITWARWASIYTGAKLYDYAVSGAVCSEEQISRYQSSLKGPFPGVLEYEVPAFIADTEYVNSSTNTNTLYTDRQADNTVYSMWIGTNDLGVGAILQDQQKPGTNITTFTDCVFQAFDGIYSTGGRYFVLMNTAPLQLSPLYGLPGVGGLTSSKFWPNKPENITAVSSKMLEYTETVNRIWAFQVPYLTKLTNRYPNASIAIYDVHSLLTDIYYNPSQYLNGTNGYTNVTVPYYSCNSNSSSCVLGMGSKDGYMWYDELHPSEQVDRVIGREFVEVVEGRSKYAAYW